MDVGRLIIDSPAGGTWNMAVDDVLLQSASESGRCSLRFYRWSEPTLTIGYFQQRSDRSGHSPSRALPLVRRASGGGAIVHDAELTYSFVAPVSDRVARNVQSLYYCFHETLLGSMADWNIEAALCGEVRQDGPSDPFLCFQRRTPGDVLIKAVKVAGSAQRRYRRAVLQHGSILLRTSSSAPELAGISEVAGVAISHSALMQAWLARISSRLRMRFEAEQLDRAESELAKRRERAKFASRAWGHRR